MAGCFGNHPVDKYLERELLNHLNDEVNSSECYMCHKETKMFCENCDDPVCEIHSKEGSKEEILCLECFDTLNKFNKNDTNS